MVESSFTISFLLSLLHRLTAKTGQPYRSVVVVHKDFHTCGLVNANMMLLLITIFNHISCFFVILVCYFRSKMLVFNFSETNIWLSVRNDY
jgi:hypothetical protein